MQRPAMPRPSVISQDCHCYLLKTEQGIIRAKQGTLFQFDFNSSRRICARCRRLYPRLMALHMPDFL